MGFLVDLLPCIPDGTAHVVSLSRLDGAGFSSLSLSSSSFYSVLDRLEMETRCLVLFLLECTNELGRLYPSDPGACMAREEGADPIHGREMDFDTETNAQEPESLSAIHSPFALFVFFCFSLHLIIESLIK